MLTLFLFLANSPVLAGGKRRRRRASGGGKERTENMALFKRKDLESKGLNEEQINFIMTEGNRALAADYLPKSSMQEEIDKAVAQARESTPPPDVKSTPEYAELAAERDMLRAIGGDDFSGVKPKFRETVYKMLDRSDGAPAVPDQMKQIATEWEEYFSPAEQPRQNSPVFSNQPPQPMQQPTAEDAEVAKALAAW